MTIQVSRRDVLACVGTSIAAVSGYPTRLFAQQPACAKTHDDIYYDQLGLIVQQNCDGGDTAQREGMYWLGYWMWENDLHIGRYGERRNLGFSQVMDLLEDEKKTGSFRRHPTQKDHNLPKNTSRDQLIPLIAAMGVYQDFVRLDRLRDRIHQKFYFVNTDWLIFFDEYMKRALDRDLQFNGETDKFLLDGAVDLLLRSKVTKDMDNVGDDLNLIVQLLLAAVRRGENVKAIRAKYATRRPKNYGVYLTRYRFDFPNDFSASKEDMISRIETGIKKHGWTPDCTSVLGVLKWYFRAETGGVPV